MLSPVLCKERILAILTSDWVIGIGEDIRGSVLGAIESGQGSEEAKAKEEGIATKGRSEIERGVAQMKGVAVPASTTAGPESHVEGKTSGQQQQPAKQEASESPAPASAGPTQATGSAGAESHVEGKIGEQPQQQPAKQETSGPPPPTPVSPQAAVRTDESRQAEPVSSRQEPTGQAGKSSQGTQAGASALLFL